MSHDERAVVSAPLRLTIYAAIATITAALSLASVFSSSNWVVPVIGAIVLVSATSALVRWSPLPSAVEPLSAAVAVLLWITFLDARPEAHLGFIPGRTALRHLGRLARHGFNDVHRLPTPVPTHKGLVLLAVIGVAAVALIVDLLTVTLRRAALAGLPLLALFTICAATGRSGVNIFAFIAAAVGYLWLLYVDNRERVTRWGAAIGTGSRARPASAWSTDPSSAPAPATLGRRVGAAAIGISVVIPLVIPGMHSGIDHHGSGSGDGGGGNVHTFDPIVYVGNVLGQQVNRPVLDYTTTASNPGYLRLTSLDIYNDGAFSSAELKAPQSARVSNGLGVTPPSHTEVTTNVRVENGYDFRWLPVPSTAVSVKINGDWRYDPSTATIFSASTTTSGSHYTVESSPDEPTPTELANDSSGVGQLELDLQTPGVSTRVRTLTQRLTGHASSEYEAALEIQRYLTSNRFTYDASIPPDNGPDPLGDFLFHTKRGFCQQFATAMAVMARLAGIPSRVAVGFTAGARQPDGSYLVTTHDAHAWPELWFPNYGWLPFEPTPRTDGQAQTPSYARVKPGQLGSKIPGPKESLAPQPGGVKADLPHKGVGGKSQPIGGSSAGTSSSGSHLALLIVLLIILVVAMLLAIPFTVRDLTRRRRWRALADHPEAIGLAWAELRDSAIDAQAPWDDAGTPRTLAAALIDWAGPDAAITEPLRRLTVVEEHDRYAASPRPVEGSLRADTEAVTTAFRRDVSRGQRLRRAMFPASTMRMIRARLTVLADLVDRLERVPGQVIGQVRLRRPRTRPT